MAKLNKNTIIGIAVAVVVVVVIAIVVVVINNKPNNGGDNSGTDQNSEIVEDELSIIDVNINYGDYDEMATQAKAIQNGEMTGMVIIVDGIVSHPMSKYSIVEEDEDGNKIGTEFFIEGLDEEEYPKDGDHVIITGKVVEKQPLYYVIRTLPDYVEIIEEDEETEEE